MSPPGQPPLLSVTVPTRGRAEQLAACVRGILACEGPAFEVLVVDQSDDRASAEALRPLLVDPRLRYLRSDTRGVCAARNVGISQSQAALLVCTDDDCRPPSDWLRNYQRAFDAAPEAALISGQVTVAEPLDSYSYAANWQAAASRCTFDSLGDFGWGITANMALRRSLVELIGPFDAALGAGGVLRSGGEPDLLYRALRAGQVLLNRPEPTLVHSGVRRGADVKPLWRRYHFGIAAAFWKHVRLGDAAARQIVWRLNAHLVRTITSGLRRHGRPDGALKLLSFWQGVAASLQLGVDPKTRLYRLPK